MSGLEQKRLENQQRVLVFIWLGFISSLFVYLLLPALVLSNQPTNADLPLDFLRNVFWVAMLINLGVLLWWRGRYLSKETILQELVQGDGLTAVSNFLTRKIVGFAIAESIAIQGLVLVLLGRYLWDQYIFTGISGALLIQLYPSRSFFEELLRELQGRGIS